MFMENEVLNLFDNFDEDLFAKMNIPDIMRTDIMSWTERFCLKWNCRVMRYPISVRI